MAENDVVARLPLETIQAALDGAIRILIELTKTDASIVGSVALMASALEQIGAEIAEQRAEVERLRAENARLNAPAELFWCSRCGRSTDTRDGDGHLCNWCINESESSSH
jgi:hypothetical protein